MTNKALHKALSLFPSANRIIENCNGHFMWRTSATVIVENANEEPGQWNAIYTEETSSALMSAGISWHIV